jgi:hypothetical protein
VLNTQGRPDRSKVFHVNLGRGREATELLQRMAEEGSPEDPWGLAFRIIASKRRRERTVWRTIQDSEGNWAGTRKETAMALIRKYFPVDDPETDTPDKRTTRETETR